MKTLFDKAFDAWKVEGTRFWTVFSFMSAVNGALFVGVFLRREPEAPLGLYAGLGVALCLIWFGIQRRLAYWVAARRSKVGQLEEEYRKAAGNDALENKAQIAPTVPKVFGDFPSVRETRLMALDRRFPGLSSRFGGCAMPVVFIGGWILVGLQGNTPMAFNITDNWDEAAKLLLAISGLLCLYFGYQLLVTGMTVKDRPKRWYAPGAAFTVLGVVAWFILAVLLRRPG